jgi:hypothetical protein
MEEDLKQAAADEEVKVALANKVSLERIGVEVVFKGFVCVEFKTLVNKESSYIVSWFLG